MTDIREVIKGLREGWNDGDDDDFCADIMDVNVMHVDFEGHKHPLIPVPDRQNRD